MGEQGSIQLIHYNASPRRPHRSTSYKYCSRCRLYFTGMIDKLMRCPYCNTLLRSKKPRKGRRVDPSRYGVDPDSHEVSEVRVVVRHRGEAERLEAVESIGG